MLVKRIEQLKNIADVEITAVIVIADGMTSNGRITGAQRIEEQFGAKVYSIITREDIEKAIENNIIAGRNT